VDFNWDAIGAVSESLGVIGVIVTVVYVGVQIRHNSQAVQGATEQALMSQEMALYALLAEHANIYRRGSENADQLDADEYAVFEHLVSALMSQLYSAFVQFQRGLIPQSVWDAYTADWPDHINRLGFRHAWERIKHGYPAEFRQYLDKITPEIDI
jgi:hypothetical protein